MSYQEIRERSTRLCVSESKLGNCQTLEGTGTIRAREQGQLKVAHHGDSWCGCGAAVALLQSALSSIARFVIEFLSSKLIARGRPMQQGSLLTLLRRGALARLSLAATASVVVLVVIVMVGLQNALPQLLLSSVDVCVQLVSVLADRELLVVVDGNVDATRANRFVLRVVELCYIGVSEGLICSQTPSRVELKQAAKQVQSVVRGRGEQIPQPAGLGGRQRLQHRGSQRTVDSLDIFA